MTYSINMLALPLVLSIWVVDAYLLGLLARGILSRLPNRGGSQLRSCLNQFTEPLFRAVKYRLQRHAAKPIKSWVPWAVIVLAGLIIRHFLLVLLIALQG